MIVAVALAVAGCTGEGHGEAAATPSAPPAPVVAPATRAVAPADAGDLAGLMKTLAAAAVYHEAPARKTLYTWTTPEQGAELAARPVLLTRETTDGGERSRFDAALASEPGAVAKSLLQPGRRARRFAWPVPWATVMGWDGAGWGGVLVRVELRPEAITAVFRPGEPWQFFDLRGQPVTEASVLAAPERLAVVYHVAPASAERPGFREHVLVNEQMIESWALGGSGLRAEIERDAETLGVVADRIDAMRALAATRCEAEGAASCAEAELPEGPGELAAWSGRLIAGPWARAPAERDRLLAELYAACLAVPGAAYVPSGAKIRAIADRMKAATLQPEALSVTPEPSARAGPQRAKQKPEAKSRRDRRLEERCRWDLSLADCHRGEGK